MVRVSEYLHEAAGRVIRELSAPNTVGVGTCAVSTLVGTEGVLRLISLVERSSGIPPERISPLGLASFYAGEAVVCLGSLRIADFMAERVLPQNSFPQEER